MRSASLVLPSLALTGVLLGGSVEAQPSGRPAGLRVTVVDQLGAILVGAIVSVCADGLPEDSAALTVTDERGVATVDGLAPWQQDPAWRLPTWRR